MENSEYFLNSNDDMIYHNNFIDDLISIIETHYPATASCSLVENFHTNNPPVFVDKDLTDFSQKSIDLFLSNYKKDKYKRKELTYGYNHPIMCKSIDILSAGGYAGNWDQSFISGFVRDDIFPFILWARSEQTYKFIVSKNSTVFHLSSYTCNRLPIGYRDKHCRSGNDKFKEMTGIDIIEFRNKIIKLGEKVL